MLRRQQTGKIAISCNDRIKDLGVFFPVLFDPAHIAGRKQEGGSIAQRPHEVSKDDVAGDNGQCLVELRIERENLVDVVILDSTGAFFQDFL